MGSELKGIAVEKFDMLTRGLLPAAAAINVFNFIRDIPYYIDPEQFDADEGPCNMLVSGRGSCFPKHYLLGAMLEKLGFRIEYSLYAFHWKDQAIALPEEARRRAFGVPQTYHMACRMFSRVKWVTLDVTWNKELYAKGFPVNMDWDAESGTKLAVSAFDEIPAGTAPEAAKLAKKKFSAYTLGERLELSRFTIELNRWVRQMGNEGRKK
ncbi:MAG: hypothetical protein WCV56_08945 [Candidatus Omnitrophota bacterium]